MMISKGNLKLGLWKIQKALLTNDISLKTILIKQKCFHPVKKMDFSIQNVLCKLLSKKPFFQNLSQKSFL